MSFQQRKKNWIYSNIGHQNNSMFLGLGIRIGCYEQMQHNPKMTLFPYIRL
jgi:hypothetical protein